MSFTIREKKSAQDMENFYALSFETARNTNDIHYQRLKEANPDKSDDELLELFKAEASSFDFDDPKCRIFIAENDKLVFAGHIWVAIRNSEDIWDFERPLWIYDVSVCPQFIGKGLGRKLLRHAEQWAKEQRLNIGLFVHATNTRAINLYRSEGYKNKVIPVTKELSHDKKLRTPIAHFFFRKETERDLKPVYVLGFERFKRLVLLGKEVAEEKMRGRYQQHLSKYCSDGSEHCRYVAQSDLGVLAGLVWVGRASFNEELAMIYDIAVSPEFRNQGLEEALIAQAELWAIEQGLTRIHLLLHAHDDIPLEIYHLLGYREPGYFMEKKTTG